MKSRRNNKLPWQWRADLMKPVYPEKGLTIEAVTEAARMAAARGEWNRVDECYQQREALLAQEAVSPDILERIAAIDRMIVEQIIVAQAGLTSLIDEAARTRQRIQGLRRWNGGLPLDSGTIERHI